MIKPLTTLALILNLVLTFLSVRGQDPLINLGSYNAVDWNTLNSSGYMSLHPANAPGQSQNLPPTGDSYYNFINWNNGVFQTQMSFVNGSYGKIYYRTRYVPTAWSDGYNNWGQLISTENVAGDVTVDGKLKVGSSLSPQTFNVFGGIGFTNQNANDKKLYSPVDGVLEWMTHNAAGEHGFSISHQGIRSVYFNTSGNSYLIGGNLGIGITTPDEKLTVKGKIHAQEVRLDLSFPGPDYVFEKDYKLPSLTETQKYIKENKHLPEVPSAKEMEEKGINLSEMNMLLLKKVEELTLHLIEQDKVNKAQNIKIEEVIKMNHLILKRVRDIK
jgi:hypothetical protein